MTSNYQAPWIHIWMNSSPFFSFINNPVNVLCGPFQNEFLTSTTIPNLYFFFTIDNNYLSVENKIKLD